MFSTCMSWASRRSCITRSWKRIGRRRRSSNTVISSRRFITTAGIASVRACRSRSRSSINRSRSSMMRCRRRRNTVRPGRRISRFWTTATCIPVTGRPARGYSSWEIYSRHGRLFAGFSSISTRSTPGAGKTARTPGPATVALSRTTRSIRN